MMAWLDCHKCLCESRIVLCAHSVWATVWRTEGAEERWRAGNEILNTLRHSKTIICTANGWEHVVLPNRR
jgi:hypothetical protein